MNEYIPMVLFAHGIKLCQKIKGTADKNDPKTLRVNTPSVELVL